MEQAHKKGRPVHEYDDLVASFSSSSTSSSVSGISSGSSLESDSFEEVTSPASSSSSSSSDDVQLLVVADPLSDMSSLIQQLPIKRGLSKFYQGKSQSFTSLTSVSSLEDLEKPANPYNKRLKSCKSYAGELAERHDYVVSRAVSKSSRGSCSSLNARRGTVTSNFMSSSSRPPIHPHRSTSTNTIPNQTVLFA